MRDGEDINIFVRFCAFLASTMLLKTSFFVSREKRAHRRLCAAYWRIDI